MENNRNLYDSFYRSVILKIFGPVEYTEDQPTRTADPISSPGSDTTL